MAFIPEVRDFDTLVVLGLVPKHSYVHVYGRNIDIDTGSVPEDLWNGPAGTGGLYTGFPTGAAETVQIFSSSASDAAAGVGARTVRIEGLNASGVITSETLTLNGVATVASVNSYIRVNRAYVLTAGSSNFNVGTLTIRHSVTTANVFVVMPIGSNQSAVCAYTIPAATTGYLKSSLLTFQQTSVAQTEMRLMVRETGGAAFRNRRTVDASGPGAPEVTWRGGLKLPALTDIIWRCQALTSSNTIVSADMQILLVQD